MIVMLLNLSMAAVRIGMHCYVGSCNYHLEVARSVLQPIPAGIHASNCDIVSVFAARIMYICDFQVHIHTCFTLLFGVGPKSCELHSVCCEVQSFIVGEHSGTRSIPSQSCQV